jgi:hypothetical protein
MKLKNLLTEGFAWERRADGSLPTLKDAIHQHRKNLSEESIKDSVSIEMRGVGNAKFVIFGLNNIIRFVPDNKTHDLLASVSPGQVLDELQAYCETSTGFKFSPVYKDERAGYAFTIDMYSIISKLQG